MHTLEELDPRIDGGFRRDCDTHDDRLRPFCRLGCRAFPINFGSRPRRKRFNLQFDDGTKLTFNLYRQVHLADNSLVRVEHQINMTGLDCMLLDQSRYYFAALLSRHLSKIRDLKVLEEPVFTPATAHHGQSEASAQFKSHAALRKHRSP